MPQSTTARHALPNLFVGQAQKEITHNEALALIDGLLHMQVEATLAIPPAALTDSSDGLCWLIGTGATGAWAGRSKQIARWSAGSWRFIGPVKGMSLWHVGEGRRFFYMSNSWIGTDAITNPVGGSIVDVEARSAIAAILQHLRAIGSISA